MKTSFAKTRRKESAYFNMPYYHYAVIFNHRYTRTLLGCIEIDCGTHKVISATPSFEWSIGKNYKTTIRWAREHKLSYEFTNICYYKKR